MEAILNNTYKLKVWFLACLLGHTDLTMVCMIV